MERFGHKPCRDGCGQTVCFSTSERAANGGLRPLNTNGRRHSCNSKIGRLEAEFNRSLLDDKGWIDQCELYLGEINSHLKDYTLRLVREPKHEQRRLQ